MEKKGDKPKRLPKKPVIEKFSTAYKTARWKAFQNLICRPDQDPQKRIALERGLIKQVDYGKKKARRSQ